MKVDLHKMEHQTLTGISSAKLHTLVLKDNSGTFQNILNLIAGGGVGVESVYRKFRVRSLLH